MVTVLLPGGKIILSDSWNFGPVIHLHHGPGLEIVSKTMCRMTSLWAELEQSLHNWPMRRQMKLGDGPCFAIGANVCGRLSRIVIMQIALLSALILPDMAKLMDFSTSVWTDLIMSISMVLFTVELVALSMTDAQYLLSFFQLMDIIGTISMAFDISFLLGSKANELRLSEKHPGQSKVFLIRASRAARVGARPKLSIQRLI
eukprot:s916_g18.t1